MMMMMMKHIQEDPYVMSEKTTIAVVKVVVLLPCVADDRCRPLRGGG